MAKHSKKTVNEFPTIGISYWIGQPEKGCDISILDKRKNEQAKVKMNERMLKWLKDSIDEYLDEAGA